MNKESRLKYSESILEVAQRPYKETLDRIDLDKYVPCDVSNETLLNNLDWPNLKYPDIFSYFMYTPSVYIKCTLKVYNSSDAYS